MVLPQINHLTYIHLINSCW